MCVCVCVFDVVYHEEHADANLQGNVVVLLAEPVGFGLRKDAVVVIHHLYSVSESRVGLGWVMLAYV
jgi:hypothetical protein